MLCLSCFVIWTTHVTNRRVPGLRWSRRGELVSDLPCVPCPDCQKGTP